MGGKLGSELGLELMEEKKSKHNHFILSFMLAVGSGNIHIFI